MAVVKSFLEHFLNHFRNRKFQSIDLWPPIDDQFSDREHLELADRFIHPGATAEDIAAFDEYRHPCWCNPELIYADDAKGNEVWLHKPVQ